MIKKFTIQVGIRILMIVGFCVLFAYLFINKTWFSAGGTALAIGIQVYLLIRYVNNTNYSLSKFLEALKNEDYSVYFSPSKKGDSFAAVFNDFNLIIKIFKRNKIEKEAQHKYFDYLLEQVNLGIISIKKDDLFAETSSEEILFQNRAAIEILQQPHKYWHRIINHLPWFANEVKKIADGGKILIEIEEETGRKQLSVETIEAQILSTPYLIITFQDIRSEIEQKEIEAWHDVIRILAHEMLNSFTPVSSLAATMKSRTENEQGEVLKVSEFTDEDIIDFNLAVSTIKKRSDGLLEFVKDYRTISNVPVPQKNEINVRQFISNVELLMKASLEEAKVDLTVALIPKNATIQADAKLIEQVFINLINNSIHALQGRENPTIQITCIIDPYQTIIQVRDNGRGMEENVINKIFIPFFTTKKNGSGIGLSLSKSILKKHGGNLTVHSEPGAYTSFSMIFKN